MSLPNHLGARMDVWRRALHPSVRAEKVLVLSPRPPRPPHDAAAPPPPPPSSIAPPMPVCVLVGIIGLAFVLLLVFMWVTQMAFPSNVVVMQR